MGIFIKRRQGTEYLYLLAGNSQYFLGRKDDLENLNLQNLRKAAKIVDKNFDKIFTKYIMDLQECAKYIPKEERSKYLSNRIKDLDAILGKLI